MTLNSMMALFGAMAVLAAMPGVSVLVVSARSAAAGFRHGLFTTLGIVAGDIFFILLAILGLAVLAETMGSLFVLVKYVGGVYLIWLGIMLWRSSAKAVETEEVVTSSLLSSFLTGLLITLGDQTAILFYLGFFPTFVDLTTITPREVGLIIAITIVAVGGVKLIYAYFADRASMLLNRPLQQTINRVAGLLLIIIGVAVMLPL